MSCGDQSRRALLWANQVRAARSEFKKGLRQLPAPEALAVATREARRPARELGRMPTADFLIAIPRVGKVRADELIRRAKAKPKTPISDLSPEVREHLTRSLNELAQRRYGKEATRV